VAGRSPGTNTAGRSARCSSGEESGGGSGGGGEGSGGRALRLRNLGASTIARYMPPRNRTHVSEKPVALLEWLISNHPWESVLDPFMGSGTTLEAAKQEGATVVGVEIEERWCEVAAHRLEQGILCTANNSITQNDKT
jgi:DNA modification methylase